MNGFRFGSAAEVPDSTYVELVESLFATRLPTIVMSLLFAAAGSVICWHAHDVTLTELFAAGVAMSALRIAVACREGRRLSLSRHRPRIAAQVERRFAATYLAFAACLGSFGARALDGTRGRFDMLASVLLVGYAAGVAAGTALRPRISIASLLLAILPTTIVLACTPDVASRMTAFALCAFLAGGVRSVVERYRSQSDRTTRRNALAVMAHRDHLTGLPNRLALIVRFEQLLAEPSGRRLAVHCLDLDGFKPINDRYGHPTGDSLLVAVADRLQASASGDDFVARLGGDEFVFVQTSVDNGHEAAMMAMRLERLLGEPYPHLGVEFAVGASVGYAVQTPGNMHLDGLIEAADEALLIRKAHRKTDAETAREARRTR